MAGRSVANRKLHSKRGTILILRMTFTPLNPFFASVQPGSLQPAAL